MSFSTTPNIFTLELHDHRMYDHTCCCCTLLLYFLVEIFRKICTYIYITFTIYVCGHHHLHARQHLISNEHFHTFKTHIRILTPTSEKASRELETLIGACTPDIQAVNFVCIRALLLLFKHK